MELAKIEAYESLFPKGAIIDGVADAVRYFKSSPRIAWFLKEAYTNEEEGWHIRKYYGQENAYENFFRNTAKPTWHPIIYASYCILNGFKRWEEVPYIREKPEMCDIVKNIAIINGSKSPSKTGTYTTFPNLNEGFENDKPLILEQIAALEPEIHVFGSTFYLYKDSFGLLGEHQVHVGEEFDHCGVWIKDGKLYLDVYHPSNTSQSNPTYVNQIVKAAEFWAAQKAL